MNADGSNQTRLPTTRHLMTPRRSRLTATASRFEHEGYELVEQESTLTVLASLREVMEGQGVFCALYSDRASHFFLTQRLTPNDGSVSNAFICPVRDAQWPRA